MSDIHFNIPGVPHQLHLMVARAIPKIPGLRCISVVSEGGGKVTLNLAYKDEELAGLLRNNLIGRLRCDDIDFEWLGIYPGAK